MHPPEAGGRPLSAAFALPDAPVTAKLRTITGDGIVAVTSARLADCLVRVGRVLGLAGPWSADELSDTLDGVLQVTLLIRGRDPCGRLLADVVGVDDADDRILGAEAQRR